MDITFSEIYTHRKDHCITRWFDIMFDGRVVAFAEKYHHPYETGMVYEIRRASMSERNSEFESIRHIYGDAKTVKRRIREHMEHSGLNV